MRVEEEEGRDWLGRDMEVVLWRKLVWERWELTFRSFDANLLEEISLLHGPDDSLHKLFDLFVQSSNIGVLLCRLLVHFHGFDSTVILRW